ncbi:MAG TPA: 30S ribosomal protein S12 methylthiotransferase RimO [Polyangiaceae bacterium]|nr:30S ribosomal protein S12 methylthiotransferase RimO [Polyangiaceae bacterium]
MKADRNIHFVSLGCPKNRVDSEVMVGVAQDRGFTPTDEAEDADVIVINTCGFIEAAKRESIETILALAELKQTGRCRKLVVTGCLSQRYSGDLASDLPEVDHFLGSSDMLKLGAVLRGEAPRIAVGNPADWVIRASDPRTLSTRGASAYLKIAEGCNRSCGFCVIPQIRGKQRSRSADDVVLEAEQLADSGVLELNLVSQDTVSYGRDVKGAPGLATLVERLAEVRGIEWLRLHYLYPEKLDERLLELLREHPKVLPYVDMPLQHASPAMLRRMLRGGSTNLRAVVERLRESVPGVVLRSAFIVGHPGESEAEFEELAGFLRWAELDHVGVFQYSDEETCASHELADKVDDATAEARASALIELQRSISRRKNEARIGSELRVLVEGPSEESELVMVGRHAGQAPDVDGVVYLSHGPVQPGNFCTARVASVLDYDLLAEAEPNEAPARQHAARPSSAAVRRRRGVVTLRTVS